MNDNNPLWYKGLLVLTRVIDTILFFKLLHLMSLYPSGETKDILWVMMAMLFTLDNLKKNK